MIKTGKSDPMGSGVVGKQEKFEVRSFEKENEPCNINQEFLPKEIYSQSI